MDILPAVLDFQTISTLHYHLSKQISLRLNASRLVASYRAFQCRSLLMTQYDHPHHPQLLALPRNPTPRTLP